MVRVKNNSPAAAVPIVQEPAEEEKVYSIGLVGDAGVGMFEC